MLCSPAQPPVPAQPRLLPPACQRAAGREAPAPHSPEASISILPPSAIGNWQLRPAGHRFGPLPFPAAIAQGAPAARHLRLRRGPAAAAAAHPRRLATAVLNPQRRSRSLRHLAASRPRLPARPPTTTPGWKAAAPMGGAAAAAPPARTPAIQLDHLRGPRADQARPGVVAAQAAPTARAAQAQRTGVTRLLLPVHCLRVTLRVLSRARCRMPCAP